MNKKQVIKVKNSDVGLTDFRKLNNAGENFLTESGVYKLVFKSRKPDAEKFTDWVTDEVLPTLRKTGYYEVPKKKEDKKEDKNNSNNFNFANSNNKEERNTIVKPLRVVKLKVKKSSKRSVKISWKKQKNASGYEVYRSTKKNKSFKKITTLEKSWKSNLCKQKTEKRKNILLQSTCL